MTDTRAVTFTSVVMLCIIAVLVCLGVYAFMQSGYMSMLGGFCLSSAILLTFSLLDGLYCFYKRKQKNTNYEEL